MGRVRGDLHRQKISRLGNMGTVCSTAGGSLSRVALRAMIQRRTMLYMVAGWPAVRARSMCHRRPLRKRRWRFYADDTLKGSQFASVPLDTGDVEPPHWEQASQSTRARLGKQLDLGFHKGAMSTRTCRQVVELRPSTLRPGSTPSTIDKLIKEAV